MVKKGAEERTKTFWFRNRWLFGPPKFTVRSERNVFPSSFSCFLFFCRTFTCWGKHQSPPCGSNTSSAHKERRASVVLICLHCSKEGTVYPRKTMRQLRKVCHAEGVLCLSSWQQSWANPADEAFLARCWSGRLPPPGKAKSLLCKTWQTYRQGYKPQRLYK